MTTSEQNTATGDGVGVPVQPTGTPTKTRAPGLRERIVARHDAFDARFDAKTKEIGRRAKAYLVAVYRAEE